MDRIGHYRAYMLRMWSVERSGIARWRASLEDPHSGEIKGFSNIDALIDFLHELAGNRQAERQDIPDSEPRQ